ncbi:MAG: 50S ribosomal protein L24 [Candidatus Micrarchaeia archaeon]
MKSDSERKKYHSEKLHQRKNRLHVHLSKELRGKLKKKTRAILVRKGDSVKVMRGPEKGKETRVSDVNTIRRKVYLEGVVVKNARGREVPVALEPSNLLLLSLESTPERKEMFSEEAFRKKEAPKKEPPKPAAPEAAKPETDGHKHEHAKSESKPQETHKPHKEHTPVNKPQEAHKEHKPAHSK